MSFKKAITRFTYSRTYQKKSGNEVTFPDFELVYFVGADLQSLLIPQISTP